MDRVNRAEGETDFRYDQFQDALKTLESDQPNRAENVLLAFSDPTNEPIPVATTKAPAVPGRARETTTDCHDAIYRTSRPHGQPDDG